ncbi:MAG: metallophosphoesterase family protein [Candidatus Helarchaeota archaeon]
MKFLAFSDFHGLFGLKNHFIDIKKKIKEYEPDFIILCGDFRNRASINLLNNRVKSLRLPVFYVWGNDDEVDPSFNLKYGTNMHLKLLQIPGSLDLFITGIGGDEIDVSNNITIFDKLLNNNLPLNGKIIIISHVPPYTICDKTIDNKNAGVKKYLEIILKYHPNLVLFGHIHEQFGCMKTINNIIFQNVGVKGIFIEYINDSFIINIEI